MCWNAEVSLNTFLFSGFVLLLIMYNNAYTQYKIKELDNIWAYLFFASFIFMQLIEFFIWRNIDNPFYNRLFTILATLLILLQPIASMMLLTNTKTLNILLSLYLFIAVPFASYIFFYDKKYSNITKNNHLDWSITNIFPKNISIFIALIWLCFFLFPLCNIKYFYRFLFGFLTLLVIAYNYYNDQSLASMWCWVVNSLMLYYATYLLFYLPFFK